MKKTYSAPEATAIKIETVGMLAESVGLHSGNATTGNPVNSLGHSNDGDDW